MTTPLVCPDALPSATLADALPPTDRLAFQVAALTLERATLEQEMLRLQQQNAQLALENSHLRQELTKNAIPQARRHVEELERLIKDQYRVADLIRDIDWDTGAIRRGSGSPTAPEG